MADENNIVLFKTKVKTNKIPGFVLSWVKVSVSLANSLVKMPRSIRLDQGFKWDFRSPGAHCPGLSLYRMAKPERTKTNSEYSVYFNT